MVGLELEVATVAVDRGQEGQLETQADQQLRQHADPRGLAAVAGSVCAAWWQHRIWRGATRVDFLTAERHPEIGGLNGNCWTRYTYDSRGNTRSRRFDDTAFALDYRYDGAGRLVRLSNGADPLKEFFYARGNNGTDKRAGKLVRAVRHNHVDVVSPHAHIPRVVSNGYTNGFLTSVAGFASTISNQLGGALVHRVTTANGVKWDQAIGSERLIRPASIATSDVQSGLGWSTGIFSYDGVWNIRAMGNAQFAYDKRNRLVSGQVDIGASVLTQQAVYDDFGNLTSLSTGGTPMPIAVSGATNRLVSSGTTTVQYDVAGNLRDYNTGTDHLSWGWDALGAMESLQASDLAALYIYDASDERILSWHCPVDACGQNTSYERWTLRGFGGEVLRAYEGPDTPSLLWKEDFLYRGRSSWPPNATAKPSTSTPTTSAPPAKSPTPPAPR